MFEFSIVKSYLWPKKKQLSVSLIALMSVFVISLVVWLLLLFLSVTEGIEKNWLQKLTALNAPIRLVPTEEYFNSYYYQVDSISARSGYAHKSIGEKLIASLSDPHQPDLDESVPLYWELPVRSDTGELRDLVKGVFNALDGQHLTAQDYEVAGALIRLRLLRPSQGFLQESNQQSFLTQVSYIASFADKSPAMQALLMPPTAEDIDHLLYLAALAHEEGALTDIPETPEMGAYPLSQLHAILDHIEIEKIRINAHRWTLPHSLLPEGLSLRGSMTMGRTGISYILIEKSPTKGAGELIMKEGQLLFLAEGKSYPLKGDLPIFIDSDMTCDASLLPHSFENAHALSDLQLHLKIDLQGKSIEGAIPWKAIRLHEVKVTTAFKEEPKVAPPWLYSVNGKQILPASGVILPKNFRENHVKVGDKGYFAYGAATMTAVQEERLPITVVGFYDPGVMAIGARFILSETPLVHDINSATHSMALDPLFSNGIQVWCSDIKETKKRAGEIKEALEREGLTPYWKVITFYEYDFAKDLMGQFQSDRYLFMLVGALILFVACCNIISLLLLLVNDKRHEIGILLSLGATRYSIASIFGLSGMILGLLSCLIGTLIAYFTLAHIDQLVHLLNWIEGQEAFNSAFYGKGLSGALSHRSIIFIAVATPILSLIAGLLPAVKACRLRPSTILRSE